MTSNIILTHKDGRQIREFKTAVYDQNTNSGNYDFSLEIPLEEYDDLVEMGCRIFVPNTEIGGFIGGTYRDSDLSTITLTGYTFRGRLFKKIIVPPSGQAYKTVSGELNAIIRSIIEPLFDGVYVVPNVSTGVNISSYQFERFTDVLTGLTKMLETVGYKLTLRYQMGEPNGSGWVSVYATPIVDYSDDIELSQDSRIKFTLEEKHDGVNHLVVGGKGELENRNVFHLYVDGNGNISRNQYYFGIDEITEFYENTSTDTAELENTASDKLEELKDWYAFEMDVEALGIEIDIGDIIGGRDYATGMSIKKPLTDIVYKIDAIGTISKEYKMEG